ncbi:MAG: glycosyltransferase family 39 protein [Candidatus Methanomethyliaceae archaeon]
MTIIEVAFIMIFSYKHESTFCISKGQIKQVDIALIAVVALYLILALYWQQYAPAPHSDGAAYMDMARNVVEKGDFYSNMLLPTNTWYYVEYSSGRHNHMFGYFAISLFFMLGNESLFSAKIMLIFTGMLIILVVYELVKKLFSANAARLAALITAISPEFLTHVGLVGGPEITSALFTVFAICLLINAPASKKRFRRAFMAGLSLFIAWYAWYFNFFVFVTFLPLLFMYVGMKNKEFNIADVLVLLILIVSFILEWQVLLNLFYSIAGVPIPSLIIAVLALTYLLKIRKDKTKRTLVTFIVMLIVLYSALYSRCIFASFIPELQQWTVSVQPGMSFVFSNIERNIGVLSRAFNLQEVNRYWDMYWDGVYEYLGTVVVFLGIVGLARIDKIRETALIISFPLLQAVWWGLFVTIDAFQPRFIVCSSLFYFILAASAIELFCLYGIKTSDMAKLSINIKVKLWKVWKASRYINKKNLVAMFTVGLLLASVFNFTYPLYDKHKKIMEDWDYPRIYGWGPAIQWIRENTQTDDVIMSIYGNYFAWYTNRPVVPLSTSLYPKNLDAGELIKMIKEFNVKYLIVEYASASYYNTLKKLYSDLKSFYGSEVIFQHINDKGFKTIVYNVTNISFGNYTRFDMIVSLCENLDGWSPNTYYGSGNLTLDNSEKIEGNASIRTSFTVIERPLPQASIIFNVNPALNFTNFTFIEMWIKVPQCKDFVVVLMTDQNNYATYTIDGVPENKWYNLIISIYSPQQIFGSPDFGKITSFRIYVRGLEVNKTYSFWVDYITAYSEVYSIK